MGGWWKVEAAGRMIMLKVLWSESPGMHTKITRSSEQPDWPRKGLLTLRPTLSAPALAMGDHNCGPP